MGYGIQGIPRFSWRIYEFTGKYIPYIYTIGIDIAEVSTATNLHSMATVLGPKYVTK